MKTEGRVAAIVSVREVAINLGDNDGVKQGMIFAILAKTPLRVKDPDTGKVLGQFDREKIRVRVEETHAKFSICRTYELEPAPLFARTLDALTVLPSAASRRPRTLRVEDSELPPPLPEHESYVKVGDRVRLIAEAPQKSSSQREE